MDTLVDVERLKMKLSDTTSWRLDTQVKIQAQQTIFFSWCDKAKNILQDNSRKITIEVMKQLAEESVIYPPNPDTVKRIRRDANAVTSPNATNLCYEVVPGFSRGPLNPRL